jgi:acyl dehydratase
MDSTKVPLGVTNGPVTSYVDPDEVVAFARAINDENPAYLEHGAVPPTWPVTPALPVMMPLANLPDAATSERTGGVHGEHDLFIRKPIVPGMRLHTTGERVSVVVSKAGMNVFPRLVSVDDDGDVVVEQYWSTLSMGPVTGDSQGPPPPDHLFPDDARQRLVGTMSLFTTRDQTFRYAGASSDRAPMHVNDAIAQSMGFPKKFNQGLCTLGVSTRALVDLAAGGDPRRITRVAVRFASLAFPGDDIEVSVYDIGETDDGNHAFAFEADSAGRGVLRHGRVEVEPA